MSQSCVERVIGLLVTDEGLRRRFSRNHRAALEELALRGMVLTESELDALSGLDSDTLSSFALVIDARLQKADLQGEAP